MDKSVNVSIAGIPFLMETEAYRLLKDYLVRIEMGYKDNPDGAEIVADIEGRIGELILNRQSADVPVTPQVISDIVAQLGYPDDLGRTEGDIPRGAESSIPRRLYRNPDGAKLGGVCSGLATYFNTDPILVRLTFCAPLVMFIVFILSPHIASFMGIMTAISVLFYFILWFAIPKAKTPRQRLEMQGEPITARRIEESLREDFDDVSTPEKSHRNASVLSDLVYIIGKITLFLIKAVVLVIGFSIAMTVIATVIAAIVALTGGAMILGPEFWAALGIQGAAPGVIMTLGVLLALIPLVLFGYLLLRFVFTMPKGKTAMSILLGVWVIILIYVYVLTARNVDNVRDAIDSGRVERYFENMEDNWEYRADRWEDAFENPELLFIDRVWERHVKRELAKEDRFEGVKEFTETKSFRLRGEKYTYQIIYRDGEVTLKRNDRLYELRDGRLHRLPAEINGSTAPFGDTEREGLVIIGHGSATYNDTIDGQPKIRKVYLETRLVDGEQVTDTVKVEYLDPE